MTVFLLIQAAPIPQTSGSANANGNFKVPKVRKPQNVETVNIQNVVNSKNVVNNNEVVPMDVDSYKNVVATDVVGMDVDNWKEDLKFWGLTD